MSNNNIVSQGGSNAMYQNLKKKTEGFTIIEVLIVLAIAALIMLIVFIAVPALRRNARNNELRNNASRVATAGVEFRTNANGALPANSVSTTAGSDAATIRNMANITAGTVTVSTAASAAAMTTGNYHIIPTNGSCNGTRAAAAGTDPRGVAVEFGLEGGGTGCIVN